MWICSVRFRLLTPYVTLILRNIIMPLTRIFPHEEVISFSYYRRLKRRGVFIESEIEYRVGPYFVLAMNVVGKVSFRIDGLEFSSMSTGAHIELHHQIYYVCFRLGLDAISENDL